MELLNLCENSINGRLRIYRNEEMFELILNIILADFCEFVEDLYNHIMTFRDARFNLLVLYRHLLPQTRTVFAHYRALLYDSDSFVFLFVFFML